MNTPYFNSQDKPKQIDFICQEEYKQSQIESNRDAEGRSYQSPSTDSSYAPDSDMTDSVECSYLSLSDSSKLTENKASNSEYPMDIDKDLHSDEYESKDE